MRSTLFTIGFAWSVFALGAPLALAADLPGSTGEGALPARSASPAGAGVLAADPARGLPDFDIRLTPDGRPTDAVEASLAQAAGSPEGAARRAEALRLLAAVPELRIDDDPLLGTPVFVRSTRAFLTAPAPGADPAGVVADYIHDHGALFGIDAKAISGARVVRNFRTDHNGVTHLTFQQQLGGLDIAGCIVRANVAADGRLINVSSTMLARGLDGGGGAPAHTLSDAEAAVAGARAAGVWLSRPPKPAGEPEGPSRRTEWLAPGGVRAGEPFTSERLYFPMTRDELRPAFRVVVPAPGVGHTYEVIIDGGDGSLLRRGDRLVADSTQPVTMRVYTSDGVAPLSPSLAAPSMFQAPTAARSLVVVRPEDVVAFSPNGWINDNDTTAAGNNADVHLDLDGNDIADAPATDGGAARVFDFPMDPAQPPSTYRDAAVTQAFYLANRFHDRLLALGFDEAAGNFQSVNFSGAGVGGDRLQVDVQDNAAGPNPSFNNANFNGSGADGTGARVQLYLFDGPSPDRDSAFAADIAYHEFAHGLSIRLLGGVPFNAGQTRGMGEGWSDFFGVCLLAEPSDDPDANYAMSPYLMYEWNSPAFHTNYYFGIRRYPYSTSLAINPLTFADTDGTQFSVPAGVPASPVTSGTPSEAHNIGEVWCATLLEARAGLWRRDGFAGNERIMRLAVDGLKLAPATPTFVQARDAILQADMVDNGGGDRAPLWAAFAKRGLGVGAVAPSPYTTTGVIESFAVPFTAEFTYPDGLPARLDPGAPSAFRVRITPVDLTLTPGTQTLIVSANGAAQEFVPLAPTAEPGVFTATIPARSCLDWVRFALRTGTDFGDRRDPPGDGMYSAQVYSDATAAVFDDFETDSGWTVGPDTATVGSWVRVDPNGTEIQPEDDHTPDPGTVCWVTGQGAPGGTLGAADVDNGYTVLTSPAFDLSGAADAAVSYFRWYVNAGAGISYADVFRVEVSTDDGRTWAAAETVGPGGPGDPDTNPGWRAARWSLSGLGLTPTAHVRVRFIAEDAGAGSAVEAAIDDFGIERLACVEPPRCLGDFNASGAISVQDVFDYLRAFFTGDTGADVDGADGVTVEDLFVFLAAYFSGCP